MDGRVPAAALVPRIALTWDDGVRDQVVDGTAVVVDISGFTTLSEQLAAIGREGTEQLIATLSRIFTVLIPATDDGGDVVKFAGDALFLLFRGTDHAKHAAHAAWNMNRVLAAIGDIHLPSARVRLRMSVGVHTGSFDFHLTGGPESVGIVLTGSAVDRVLELQAAAPAGRILVSAETAALLPGTQTAPEGDAYRLLKAGSVPLASLLSLARARGGERFLPRAFAARADLLGGDPDHRWAAIAFVQVSGLTGDPAERARIDALTTAVESAAADTDVTLLDIDPAIGGYRYFLTAGAPTAVEDPEGRLLTAALRIVAAADGLSVRAGVTSGRILAGFVGAAYRQTYSVMGDSTNLAARLTARAEPGTVLTTKAALGRAAAPLESADAGTVTVKGKSEPVEVAVVTGGGIRRAMTGPSAFFGREDELAQLRHAVAAAESGTGAAATIVGDPGIGKTRLLEEAVAGCPVPVVRVTGDRYATNRPYLVVQTLLRPLLDIPAAASPDDAGAQLTAVVERERRSLARWLPLLAPLAGASVPSTPAVDALDDEFRADRAHAALADLLDALLPDPVCLVVDDAQWVDAASAAALADLAASRPPHALLIARRPVEGGLDPLGNVIDLPPLDDDSAGSLVEGILGRALLPSDLDALLRRGAGNALFLSELAAATGSDADTLGVEQLVGERIDRLSEHDRAIVRSTAVLGSRVAVGLFERCVAPIASVDGEAVGGILELADEGVAFRSDLFREVAYAQLPFQSRREAHEKAAAVIAADRRLGGAAPDAALMAHYDAAGDSAAARDAALRAAETARAAFAPDEAVAAYRIAMRSAHAVHAPGAELLDIAERLAATALDCGRADEALEVLTGSRALATDAAGRTRVDRGRAHALMVLGRHDEAERALAAARRSARSLGESGAGLRASVIVREVALALWRADWAHARGLTLEAIALLEGRELVRADKGVLADAYRYHDIAAGELDGDDAMTHLGQALALYEELGDEESCSKVLSLQGVRAYYRGDWATSTALYGRSQRASEAAGDVVGSAIESANAAEILVDQGRLDEAFVLLRKARHTFEGSGNPYLIGFATNFQARAELRAGRAGEARERFLTAAEMFEELEDRDSLCDVTVRRVEAEVDLGDEEAARALAADLLARDDLPGLARARVLRQEGRMLRHAGDTRAALAVTDEALSSAGAALFERALCLAQLAAWKTSGGAALRAESTSILTQLGVVDILQLLRDPALALRSNAPQDRSARS